VTVSACLPDQLRAGEQQLLVEILPGAGEDPRRARAPLEADPAAGDSELWTRRARPVGGPVLAERVAGEHVRRLGGERVVRLEPEQGERVACGAVHRAQAAVVVVLSPEPVVAPALAQRSSRLACRLLPARLAGPL